MSLVSVIDIVMNYILFSCLESVDKKQVSQNSSPYTIRQLVMGMMKCVPVSPPFLPTKSNSSKEFTLVLDLDETLIHYFYTPSGGTYLIRPYCHEFLAECSKYYEIVIFTAALKDVSTNIQLIVVCRWNTKHT